MCRTGKILENSDSGAGGSGREIMAEQREEKWKKKAWNVVICHQKATPALKRKNNYRTV